MSNDKPDVSEEILNRSHQFKSTAVAPADVAGRAAAVGQAGWGVTSNPKARAAVVAICLHHPEIDPIMGDLEILGDQIYVKAQCWMKLFHSRVPIACRRWSSRLATPEEYAELDFERWKREEQGNTGFMGRGSRLWKVELEIRPFDAAPKAEKGAMFVVAEPRGDWFVATDAWGEANELNCTLQNSMKLKGDPRVLDRQALKRAKHACLQDEVSFALPAASKDFDQMSLLAEGITLVHEGAVVIDGQISEVGEPAKLPPPPTGDQPLGVDPKRDDLLKYAEDHGVPPRLRHRFVDEALRSDDPFGRLQGAVLQWIGRVGEAAGDEDREPAQADDSEIIAIMLRHVDRAGFDPSAPEFAKVAKNALNEPDPIAAFEEWFGQFVKEQKSRVNGNDEAPAEPAESKPSKPSKPAKPPKRGQTTTAAPEAEETPEKPPSDQKGIF